MRLAQPIGQSGLSLPPDSYVYDIRPVADHLAITSSDDSLTLTDQSLKSVSRIPQCHASITDLATSAQFPHVAFTAGRDGLFRSWDTRTATKVLESNNACSAPILSLAGSALSTQVAVGTELTNHKATVTIWDLRLLSQPLAIYVESHNDDVTELVWHPTDASFLLSGSTDGLLNLYDTRIKDEDEAVVRTWNHGSVSHANWPAGAEVIDGHETIYAVSHDEQLASYKIPLGEGAGSSGPRYKVVEDEDVENEATTVGDVRPKLDCEYVIDFMQYAGHMVIGVGKHSESRIDLVGLWDSSSPSENTIRVDGAHGEEIVRTFHIDSANDAIFTGGEDGMVRSWRAGDDGKAAVSPGQSKEKAKGKRGDGKGRRFTPY